MKDDDNNETKVTPPEDVQKNDEKRPKLFRTFAVMCLVSVAQGVIISTYNFTGLSPSHRCLIPYCDFPHNVSYFGTENGTFAPFVEAGVTEEFYTKNHDQYLGFKSLTTQPTASVESCEFYLSELKRNSVDIELKTCSIEDVVYDHSIVLNSIVTDFGLVWGRFSINKLVEVSFTIGSIVGSLAFGLGADLLGRKTSMFVAIALTATSGSLAALVPGSLVWFTMMRFLVGFGSQGLYMLAVIYVTESSTTTKIRTMLGTLIRMPFLVGQMVMVLEAFHARRWFDLQLVSHAPIFALLLFWFSTKETEMWTSREQPEDKKDWTILQRTASKSDGIFRPIHILVRTSNLLTVCTLLGACYYGPFVIGLADLTTDVYLNTLLGPVLEVPGIIAVTFMLLKWGRRQVIMALAIITGSMCILISVLSDNPSLWKLYVIVFVLGKASSSGAMATLYLYCVELYHTDVRGSALGSFNCAVNCGALIAYILHQACDCWKVSLSFGVLCIMAGIVTLLLPEIKEKIPQTLDESGSLLAINPSDLFKTPKLAHLGKILRLKKAEKSAEKTDGVKRTDLWGAKTEGNGKNTRATSTANSVTVLTGKRTRKKYIACESNVKCQEHVLPHQIHINLH